MLVSPRNRSAAGYNGRIVGGLARDGQADLHAARRAVDHGFLRAVRSMRQHAGHHGSRNRILGLAGAVFLRHDRDRVRSRTARISWRTRAGLVERGRVGCLADVCGRLEVGGNFKMSKIAKFWSLRWQP